jgi:hypothetical protein
MCARLPRTELSSKHSLEETPDQRSSNKKTRISCDFSDYHCVRRTDIFFRCPSCSFHVELRNWLFHKTAGKWCLHLDKFHKCPASTTIRCSQRVLPEYAKVWPTMSNDTAKRLLQAGQLAKVAEAPAPLQNKLPLTIRSSQDRSTLDTVINKLNCNTNDNKLSPDSASFITSQVEREGQLEIKLSSPPATNCEPSFDCVNNGTSSRMKHSPFNFHEEPSESEAFLPVLRNHNLLPARAHTCLFSKPASHSKKKKYDEEESGLAVSSTVSHNSQAPRDDTITEAADDAAFDALLDQLDFSPFE